MDDTPQNNGNPTPVEVVDQVPEAAPAAGGLVLAADMLPEEIYLISGNTKPVFPGMVFPLVLAPGPMAEIIAESARAKGRPIGFVLAREDIPDDDPETIRKRLFHVGTAARILDLQEAPDGAVRVLLQGVKRFELLRLGVRDKKIVAQVVYLKDEPAPSGERLKAVSLAIMNTMRDLMKNNPLFSEEIKTFLSRNTWENPSLLADISVSLTSAAKEELQDILETLNLEKRLEKALFLLRKELDLNELKEKITHQIEEKISKQQREFFLREQLKAIKEELGLEKDTKTGEVERFEQRVKELTLSEEAGKRVEDELNKLRLLPQESPEYGVSRNYLDWLTSLPWGIRSEDKLDVAEARRILDRDHDGLQDVKDRILEFISVAKLRGSIAGSILCLIGPPGVGKTSLGRAIAESLNRKFFRFSLGGMRDEAEIKGHRRTYIGAMPGKFIQTLRATGTENPVIMLDEIDKIGASYQGDPASALLEVLDPEQNKDFLDHYLDVRFDLSKVLFVATANVLDTIPAPLLDRMEVIRLSGYIEEEKLAIGRRHLVPRQLPEHGLSAADIRFTDGGLRAILRGYAREAGVRSFEKAIRSCLRKVAATKAEKGLAKGVVVDAAKVAELLGRPTFLDDVLLKTSHPGIVTGLAWTPLGGSVLVIEAMAIPGKEGYRITGQLGEVMQESSAIALSYVHSNAAKLGLPADYFPRHQVHLHVPAGATKKDGPSAGITMATALISMASDRKVPPRLAMTGELTLTGKVLPVGGIKEKLIAAGRSGIQDVLLPAHNEKDYEEIPEHVRAGLTAHFVSDYKQVYDLVFAGKLADLRQQRKQ
jgi:ATP-dependent Lon protease